MSLLKNLSVFFVVFGLSLVSAQNDLEVSHQSELEAMEEIQELLRNVQVMFDTKIASKVREGKVPKDEEVDDENDVAVDPNGCSCQGLRCSCCQHIRIPKININGNTCVTVTYFTQNYQIRVTLTYENRRLFSREVSANNPPKMCVGISDRKRGASLCVQIRSLKVGEKSLSGCITLTGRLLFVTVANFNLGCFGSNTLDATQEVTEVDVPYLDESPALPEGPEPIYMGEVPMENIKPAGC